VTPRKIFEQLQDWLAATGYSGLLPFLAHLQDLLEGWPAPPLVVAALGNRLTVQECVPAALYCVLRHPDNFEKAVSFAVKLGGDADTIAAIAGAVAGAYHGVRAIPARWLDHVENDTRGRSQMAELGEQLFSAWQARAATS
jgi:poly(ADP-ribose) glycohydrolase ARH3